jgi:hypothetical protein
MKKLLFIFALSSFIGFAQDNLNNTIFERGTNHLLQINFKTENKGTPYLYDEWNEGYLVLNDSVLSPQNGIQLNLESGDLIISTGGNKETGMVITDDAVTGFAIHKNAANHHLFAKVNNSQFEDNDKPSPFYEVISNHKKTNYLLKDVKKYLYDPNKSKGYMTENSFPMEYKQRVNYFIKNKSGKYVKSKLKKKTILKILNDKSSELKAFISSKKINFKKEHDVVKVLEYYHSLK